MHPYMPDESMVGKYTRTNINHRYTRSMASIYNYIHIFIYIHTQMKFYRRFNHWLRCAGAP